MQKAKDMQGIRSVFTSYSIGAGVLVQAYDAQSLPYVHGTNISVPLHRMRGQLVSWTASCPVGAKVVTRFTTFSVADRYESVERLIVYDGNSASAQHLLTTPTPSTRKHGLPNPCTSTTSSVYVTFQSYYGAGFDVGFTCTPVTQCRACPAHSRSVRAGATSVSECMCASGNYMVVGNVPWKTQCKPCPSPSSSVLGSTNFSSCRCDAGYYMATGTCRLVP